MKRAALKGSNSKKAGSALKKAILDIFLIIPLKDIIHYCLFVKGILFVQFIGY
jgi:hypothetical protein